MTWPISGTNDDDKMFKLPITTLFRWYLYDIAGEDAHKDINVFNLSPVSEEGNDKELEDSEARLINVSSITPLISLYSEMNAKYAFSIHKKELIKIPGVTEEMLETGKESLMEFYNHITFNGIMSIFSAAIELDLVELNGLFLGPKGEVNE